VTVDCHVITHASLPSAPSLTPALNQHCVGPVVARVRLHLTRLGDCLSTGRMHLYSTHALTDKVHAHQYLLNLGLIPYKASTTK
jgi:hypothetical protein